MDVFSLIYEALQITYAIIPKELFLIILGIIIVFLYAHFNDTIGRKNSEKDNKETDGN